jgi:hypothetical protein
MKGGEPILDYLLYLREVSRKIGRQQQLEKVFVARYSDRNVFQITPANRDLQSKWLERAGEKLERESGKGLFLGVGALFGHGKVGGPLLYLELEWNREKRKWQYDLSTLSLNLDLVARLIEGEREEWEEEPLLLDQSSEVIEEVERVLGQVSSPTQLGRVGLKVLELLRRIKGFPAVEVGSPGEYSFHQEQQLLKNRRRRGEALYLSQSYRYFPALHFFIAPVPDELSTYASLSQLIGEVERGGFKNRVVGKLLKGVFHRGRVQFQERVWEEIEGKVEEILPLPLSDLQLEGVKRSFAYEISYIQGPPGTGKSHTIAAVALTAIGAGKRVLIVSQKVPAVEVLKEKLTPFLENSDQILPFVYYTKGARRELREQIGEILARYPSSRVLEEELARTRGRLAQLEGELERVRERKGRLHRELTENLELEFQFVEENEALQRKKREFQELYYQLEKSEELASPRRVAQLKGLVQELRELKERDRVERLPTLLFQLNLIYNLQTHLPNRGGTPSIFEKALRKGELLPMVERLLEIEERILQLEELGSTLRGNSDTLRRELELLEQEERGYQRKLLQLKNKLRILERLAQPHYRQELEQFQTLLRFRQGRLVANRQQQIDWGKILEIFPVWISEIRNIGEILPMEGELFDLVVVDEASQVNLAEIIPIFYRGKQILIVGDHKQLSLNSTGLNFQLNTRLDRLSWERFKPLNLSYREGRERRLLVTQASILDFIRVEENEFNIPQLMLNEHYRSMPRLAQFTNQTFYNGKLRIMTETPDRIETPVFQPIQVRRGRRRGRIVESEVDRVATLFRSLREGRRWKLEGVEGELPEIVPAKFSVGILGFTRDQVEVLKERFSLFGEQVWEEHQLMIGTAEEFQGHERDVMIISFGLDREQTRSRGFYQDPRRLNVATSRAKYFTFVVYRGIPENFHLIEHYFNFFGFSPFNRPVVQGTPDLQWRFDPTRLESEFEARLAQYLKRYIDRKREEGHNLLLFNQVQTCGQKRLDFVIYNPGTRRFVAVEADGRYHFKEDGRSYSEAHLERIQILRRAGWEIVNTPYYRWYRRGWLEEGDPVFREELERLYRELDTSLF